MGSILSKRKSTEQQTPLMRVEELLKNMKNIQSRKSKSKEKVMVNINIPRELNEWESTPIRQHTTKTPCKKCRGGI